MHITIVGVNTKFAPQQKYENEEIPANKLSLAMIGATKKSILKNQARFYTSISFR